MPVYLDCNATTPIEPRVRDKCLQYMDLEFGNAGSRTHAFGTDAQKAVNRAREQVAAIVDAAPEEVVFTSGATESNNLAILGLAAFGEKSNRRHIVATAIEHKAVLEPIEQLSERGFEVTLVPSRGDGWVQPQQIFDAVRDDTLLVSVMHVNNETGVVQPLGEIAELLSDHPAYLHTDAAQGFGKDFEPLQTKRLDLISLSGHKIYGPKGVGGLIARRRKHKRPPLAPLVFGGGQERGLRPGTQPVHLIVGLGEAAEIAKCENAERTRQCELYKSQLLDGLAALGPTIHGCPERTLANVVNLSFGTLDSEAVMLAIKDEVAISNGSACTSTSYEPSHVLIAMGLTEDQSQSALRWSWCHLTEQPDWKEITKRVQQLL